MWKNYSKELIVEGDCMKGKVRAGYSLIELMIAMAISAIVLTAIIGLIGFATRNMRITDLGGFAESGKRDIKPHDDLCDGRKPCRMG